MENELSTNNSELSRILEKLNSLEERVARLEVDNESLREVRQAISDRKSDEEEMDQEVEEIKNRFKGFETKIGEYGLAWVGNIVLFAAISLLWQYFDSIGKPAVSALIGYVSVAGIFLVSKYIHKNFTYLSFMFRLFGSITLFYITLRLHFFATSPLIANGLLVTGLLLAYLSVEVYLAIKNKSQFFMGFALVLIVFSAYMSHTTHLFFLLTGLCAAGSVYLFWRFSWWTTMLFSIFLVYISNLIWLMANPVNLASTPNDTSYLFAFTYFSITTGIYSLVALKKPNETFPENTIISTILLAGCLYSVLLLFTVATQYSGSYVAFFMAISLYSILYSILLKLKSPWKFSPALYALYGFVAISITIFGKFHFPDSYFLLVCQSFLVLILALWYRSRIITVMNTLLMLLIMIMYYSSSGDIHATNFSIPIVAFLSARIINWQKDRLNIKTEAIRNTYLLVLLISFLFACYKGFPKQYITLSWGAITIIYFGLSFILKNIKYRWMAIANLIITAFYLLFIDLANIEFLFRIIAFLALAVLSIAISLFYVKKMKKNN